MEDSFFIRQWVSQRQKSTLAKISDRTEDQVVNANIYKSFVKPQVKPDLKGTHNTERLTG